jgi:hypothetical protein
MDEERRAKWSMQTEELYAAIGRFAVKFEHVVHAMERCVSTLLTVHGLRNAALANAVLSGLTADPLLAIFRASLVEVRGATSGTEDDRILKALFARIRKLIESRNDVIHRMWFVGWAADTDEDFSAVTGIKFKNTGKGVEFRTLDFTKQDFDALSAEADEIARMVWGLIGLVVSEVPLARGLLIDVDGIVRPVRP